MNPDVAIGTAVILLWALVSLVRPSLPTTARSAATRQQLGVLAGVCLVAAFLVAAVFLRGCQG